MRAPFRRARRAAPDRIESVLSRSSRSDFRHELLFDPCTGKDVMIGGGETDKRQYEKPIQANWAGGMSTVVHRSVEDAIGLWDTPRFPQYHGVSDFCLRAKRAGIALIIHPSLRIWNDRSSPGLPHHNRLRVSARALHREVELPYRHPVPALTLRHGESPRLAGVLLLLRYLRGQLHEVESPSMVWASWC
jgi:GT2 family glycosyltransferase